MASLIRSHAKLASYESQTKLGENYVFHFNGLQESCWLLAKFLSHANGLSVRFLVINYTFFSGLHFP